MYARGSGPSTRAARLSSSERSSGIFVAAVARVRSIVRSLIADVPTRPYRSEYCPVVKVPPRVGCSSPYEALLIVRVRPGGELRAVLEPELCERMAYVALDRAHGQVQVGGDRLVRAPLATRRTTSSSRALSPPGGAAGVARRRTRARWRRRLPGGCLPPRSARRPCRGPPRARRRTLSAGRGRRVRTRRRSWTGWSTRPRSILIARAASRRRSEPARPISACGSRGESRYGRRQSTALPVVRGRARLVPGAVGGQAQVRWAWPWPHR